MKMFNGSRPVVQLIAGCVSACLILCMASILSAATMTTYDSDGRPIDMQNLIKGSPELFIPYMKNHLKKGNLTGLGGISTQLIKSHGKVQEIAALHSIFLASTGNTIEAKSLLKQISNLDTNAFALYAKAMILRIEKDDTAAIQVVDQAIALNDGHPFPWNIKGRIQFDQGLYKEAIESFQTAVKHEPDFITGQVNLGAAFYTIGDYQASVRHFLFAIEGNPDSDNARYGLGLTYEKMGQSAAAIASMEKTLEINPEHQPALQELSALYLKTRQYQKALETGKTMQRQNLAAAFEVMGTASLHLENPTDAIKFLQSAEGLSADYLLGISLMAGDRLDDALAKMEAVLEKAPGHFGAYFARSVIKLALSHTLSLDRDLKTGWGDHIDTVIYFVRGSARFLNQDRPGAYTDWQRSKGMVQGFSLEGVSQNDIEKAMTLKEIPCMNLGVFYYINNLFSFAMAEFNKGLQFNKHSLLINYWAGQTQLSLGGRKAAFSYFEAAAKQAPDFFTAHYVLGEISFLQGDQATAENFYKQALAVKHDPGVLVKLGLLKEKKGQLDEAEAYYEAMITHFPELFIGYNQLAWLYARQGINLEKAMELAGKADALQPGNASILDTIGWIHFQKKAYQTSLKFLEQAQKIDPTNPSIHYHIGAVHASLDNHENSISNIQKALDMGTDFDEREEAVKLLDQLK